MSNKIPCGGFKLDNNFLGMNENDELSLTGGSEGEGKAYKQLVTDGTGKATGEDRLCYSDELVSFTTDDMPGFVWYRVSEIVPDGSSSVSIDDSASVVYSGQVINNVVMVFADTDCYIGNELLFAVALSDNVTVSVDGIEFTIPKKGTYFLSANGITVTGMALGRKTSVDEMEITWDGNTETIKKLDEKFMPDMNSVILNSSTSSSTKKFKITVDDSGTISATEVTS